MISPQRVPGCNVYLITAAIILESNNDRSHLNSRNPITSNLLHHDISNIFDHNTFLHIYSCNLKMHNIH